MGAARMNTVQIKGEKFVIVNQVGSLAHVRRATGKKVYIAHVYGNCTAVLLQKKGA